MLPAEVGRSDIVAGVSTATWIDGWQQVVGSGDASKLEELWLERLAAGIGAGDDLLAALKLIRGANRKALAGTLLELAVEEAASEGSWGACRAFAAEMLRQGVGDDTLARAKLAAAVRHLWAGRPSLEKLLQHFDLGAARRPLEALDQIESWLTYDVGGVVLMAGKGPGRIVEANPAVGMLRLDLEQDKRVPVPIDAAPKYLTLLPEGHFLRRRLEDRGGLREQVLADPQTTLVAVLESLGPSMGVPELKSALQGLVGEDEWASWWARARKLPRLLAEGSGSRLQYRLAAGEAADGEIREQFLAASLPDRVELARRHGGRSRNLAELMGRELTRACAAPDADPVTAWEGLQLALRLGGSERAEVEALRAELVRRVGVFELLAALGDAVQREQALELARQHVPDEWAAVLAVWLEQESHPKVLGRLAVWLIERGEEAVLTRFFNQVFLQPSRFPAAFVWASEVSGDPALRSFVDEHLGGAFLVRLVELSERKEMVPYRARLRELLAAKGLAASIIGERLSLEQGRRLVQVLETPGELWEQRAWLRRAVLARFPDLLKAPVVGVIPALAATAERLQDELKRLRDKDIPEVLRAIQIAKEEGDLRENFEYHAQRARQELLSARAAKLQEDLAKLRVLDPSQVDCSVVRVGTRVTLRRADGCELTVTILGPYEADPDAGILSSGSEAAQGLLEHRPGAVVAYAGESWTIVAIVPAV